MNAAVHIAPVAYGCSVGYQGGDGGFGPVSRAYIEVGVAEVTVECYRTALVDDEIPGLNGQDKMVAAFRDGVVPSDVKEIAGWIQCQVYVAVTGAAQYLSELFVHLYQQFGALSNRGRGSDFDIAFA